MNRATTQLRNARIVRILRLSLDLMAAHRKRTALTISGLSVGVATVIVMAAAGKGAERQVTRRIRAMGVDFMVVSAAPAPRVAGRQRQVSTLTALRADDARAIQEQTPLAVAAAPMVVRTLTAKVDERNSTVQVIGTTVDGLRIRGMTARIGRIFEESEDRERRRVALVGPTVSRTLFQESDPIGREIRVNGVPFGVIAVLAARGTDVAGTDLDNEVVIPLETAMRRVLNVPFVSALLVQGSGTHQLDALERDVRAILVQRHPLRSGEGGIEPFVVQNQAVLLRTERGAVLALNRMTMAVGSLALLVGGIGAAAVMLLSVRERTREIGLRRALGARRRDIRIQFLLEAMVLTTGGGVAGLAAGVLVAMAAAAIGRWELLFPGWTAIAGVVLSVVLGLAVGLYPARRASRLEPSVALRSG